MDNTAAVNASSRKFDDMEAVRGFAALGVVFYHFLHGFLPTSQVSGWNGLGRLVIVDRPVLLALINGPFMVSIFFVLSSYVLTVKLVRESDLRSAAAAIAKRFPRLLPLTIIGSVVPAILFVGGWMANEDVAAVINSSWLERSGGVKSDPAMPPPSIVGGILDAVELFWRGWSQYNSALWTMKYELIGSVFALATAVAVGSVRRLKTDACVILVIGVAGLWVHPLVSVCVVTVFLTKYVCQPGFELPRRAIIALLVAGIVLGSTYKSLPEELLQEDWVRTQALRVDWLLHGAGAMMILVAVRGWKKSPFQDNRLGRTLGRLSFPMYVLHVPVFGSVASGIFVALGYGAASFALAFVVSITVLMVASFPLALLDEAWVQKLNTVMKRFANRDRVPSAMAADPAP
ncbi:MAG: acyltransferase [Pseudomonadota bacterium]